MMPGRQASGMGLRGRLTTFFVVITVVPLTVAVLALQVQIDQQLRVRSESELNTVRRAAVAMVEARRDRAADLAGDLAARLSGDLIAENLPRDLGEAGRDETQAWLDEAVRGGVPGRADLAMIIGPDGQVLAEMAREPQLAADREPPEMAELADAVRAETMPTGVLTAVREVRGLLAGQADATLAWVVTGIWTDDILLAQLGIASGAALVAGGEPLAVAGGIEDVPDPPTTGTTEVVQVGDQEIAISSAPLGAEGLHDVPVDLVLWTPQPARPRSLAIALLILVPSLLLAVLLGWLLASGVIAPVRRAADVARAVAGGDLGRELEPTGGPELRDLANALNKMSADLAARLEELSRSRDQLRGSLNRLGQTLSSSLDLNRILAVVVETARDTLVADRAMLMLFTPERDSLYLKVGRGLNGTAPRLVPGEGIVGHVATAQAPLRLAASEPAPAEPADGEPHAQNELAVPLVGRGRVLGVLALMRDDDEHPFTESDLETLSSFSGQASVAIENVLLHQEAQRLSVTDPLTGLWNFRYFQLQAEREVESASRFERPLSLVIIDIDHFKQVNDEHGHQVGDHVLAEVARRIRDATRTPDVVARYGGEEFVVLLPGTDLEGALSTAERVRAAVAVTPVEFGGASVAVSGIGGGTGVQALEISCSAGVATFPHHGRSVSSLLRSADAAMYQAKQRGRNRVIGAGTA